MKNKVRGLASELKTLLQNAQEDEFIKVAGTRKSGPAVSVEPAAAVKHEVKTPMSAAKNKQDILNELAAQIKKCKKCALGLTRLNAVPGEGNADAKIMFVGEGPGFDEDHQGRPFIGRAGTLLTKMIEAMGLKREDIFIANMAKCHPMLNPQTPEAHGNDRAPSLEEIAACRKFIETQIATVSPEYVVALGGVAAKSLIRDAKSLGELRGKIHNLELTEAELKRPVKIIATYHPAALLRNPGWKKDSWDDLKMLMKDAGMKMPAKTV